MPDHVVNILSLIEISIDKLYFVVRCLELSDTLINDIFRAKTMQDYIGTSIGEGIRNTLAYSCERPSDQSCLSLEIN